MPTRITSEKRITGQFRRSLVQPSAWKHGQLWDQTRLAGLDPDESWKPPRMHNVHSITAQPVPTPDCLNGGNVSPSIKELVNLLRSLKANSVIWLPHVTLNSLNLLIHSLTPHTFLNRNYGNPLWISSNYLVTCNILAIRLLDNTVNSFYHYCCHCYKLI